ncbi:MAG: outer membrane protein assembly factor BamD [Chlamydiota bacterium]|nr:outer membrane protein assembly factor BamD [Chlamydiota bacterium]
MCFICIIGCSSQSVISEARRNIKQGIKMYEEKNYLSAIHKLEAGLEILPKDQKALIYIAKAYEDVQDFEKAVNAWQKYMFVNIPTSPDAAGGQEQLDRVKNQLRAQRKWEHIKQQSDRLECRQFIEQFPDSVYISHVYFHLAKTLEQELSMKEARSYYQLIIDRYPDTPLAAGAKKRMEKLDHE